MANHTRKYETDECSVDGCEKQRKGRGLCAMHYSRWQRTGSVGSVEPQRVLRYNGQLCHCGKPAAKSALCRQHYRLERLASATVCSVDRCARPAETTGLCSMHYRRSRVNGSTGDHAPLLNLWDGRTLCPVVGCTRPARGGCGMCRTHRAQQRVLGTTPTTSVSCSQCGAIISLLRPDGSLRPLRSDLSCTDCLLRRPRNRWCMTAAEIADRDGPICSLCDDPVDLDLMWPHRLSPSVDHRIPRAKGGRDEPENLALAHLICNIRKGTQVLDP